MKKSIILFSILLLAFSCKSEYELILNSYDIEEKTKMAFELYEAGRYQKAANMFESLAPLTSGTARDDTVRYYWGLSNYYFRDYITAEGNFKSFLEYYPLSPFAENASFLRLDCLYRSTYRYELDQIPTYACMNAIREYQKDHPNNENKAICDKMMEDLQQRLDTKAYEAARLYFHIEDYIAATTAFKNVLKDNSENIYREDILFYIAKSSFRYALNSVENKRKERYLLFVDNYYNFIGEYPQSGYRNELDVLYKRAQKYLGKYNDVTEELLAKETANIEKLSKQRLNTEEMKVKRFGKAGMTPEELKAKQEQDKIAAQEYRAKKEKQRFIGQHYDTVREIARNKRNAYSKAEDLVINAESKMQSDIKALEAKKFKSEEKRQEAIEKARTKGEQNIEAAKAKAETMKAQADATYEHRMAEETKKYETFRAQTEYIKVNDRGQVNTDPDADTQVTKQTRRRRRR
ncbi:MAG: outer membrane protein assembly factor BamD [Bacteroidales bacterium]|nr:outer membrane protein assembly factor BamD [Bacteroidales bacterium]